MGLLSNPELTQKISLLHKDNTDTYHLPGKKGNFNWKIKWFMPLHLGSFRNNMGCDLMQCNFSTLISLFSWFGYTYIYRSPTKSNSIDFCNLCTRFPPRWFVQTSKHPKQLFQKIFYCQEYLKKGCLRTTRTGFIWGPWSWSKYSVPTISTICSTVVRSPLRHARWRGVCTKNITNTKYGHQ